MTPPPRHRLVAPLSGESKRRILRFRCQFKSLGRTPLEPLFQFIAFFSSKEGVGVETPTLVLSKIFNS